MEAAFIDAEKQIEFNDYQTKGHEYVLKTTKEHLSADHIRLLAKNEFGSFKSSLSSARKHARSFQTAPSSLDNRLGSIP